MAKFEITDKTGIAMDNFVDNKKLPKQAKREIMKPFIAYQRNED